jgi:LCP family protein required for cell wall assembly
MQRRTLGLLVVLTALIAACSGETVDTTTTSSQPTTTTTMPTTTTTTAPFTVAGAPPGLTAVIENFYAYLSGESTRVPDAPKPVLAAEVSPNVEMPSGGTATLGTIQERPIAVADIKGDFFLAVRGKDGWRIVGGRWPSLSIPAFYGKGPRHVAVVGSDARPGEDPANTRADSIHFVGLDGKGGGAIVGLPRDSFVNIPGHGRQKITGSLSLGGPEKLMETFDELTGLPFEGYVLTGFAGFESLLEEVLGGVTVEVPFAINDRWAHVDIDAGEQLLDGAQALGFARARKTVPGGDLTRSGHQGVILLGAARAVQAMGLSVLPELLEKSEPFITTDLSPAQLLTFSAMVVSADLDTIPNVVAPGSPGSAGGASVVYLSDSVAELWEDLADGTLEE